MSKYIKPNIDEAKLGKNPLMVDLQVRVNKMQANDKYKQDGDIWLRADVELEAVPYCKIFSDSKRRLQVSSLTPRGKDLLLWIMYEVDKNKDWIWLNKIRYMEENNIKSVNTYKDALNDLIRNVFLNKTVITDVYWINPHFFFNGNRIKKFPENVILNNV